MTDLQIERLSRRAGMLPGAGELQRRKDLRAGRRTFRAWPLLPIAARRLGATPADGPAVDWPHGIVTLSGDDWQDRPDQHRLEKDFAPASERPLWRDDKQAAVRTQGFKLRVIVSVVLHLCSAIFLVASPAPEAVEIAGGGTVSVMMVGEQAFDSLAMGKADGETAKPAEETDAAETAEQAEKAASAEQVAEATQIQSAASAPVNVGTEVTPVPETIAVAATAPTEPVAETIPHTQDPVMPLSLSPVENLAIDSKALSEAGELAQPSQVAAIDPRSLPQMQPPEAPRPSESAKPAKPVNQRGDEKKAPSLRKPERAKTEDEKSASRRKAETAINAKPAPAKSNKGDAGEANANAQRGVAAGNNSQARSGVGNAAASNYPGKVAAKLRRALKYPKSAVSGGRGETQVAFTVLPDGNATGIRIVSSSGSPVLDQAAVDAVRRASPFPPIPAEAGRGQWPFAVPVLFTR